jgi:hypothetical protein
MGKAVSAMSRSHIPSYANSSGRASEDSRLGFRTKIVATRLTPAELAEVESAAEQAGQALAEWLRETALSAARQRPANPVELLLAEVWAMRYALLNLFHAGAQAATEGRQMLPDSVIKIRDQADARKLQQARELLEDFIAPKAKHGE